MDDLPLCMMPDGADPCAAYKRQAEELRQLIQERDRLKQAINQCLDWLNGHQYDYGDRAVNALSFIEAAIGAITKGDNPDLPCWGVEEWTDNRQ